MPRQLRADVAGNIYHAHIEATPAIGTILSLVRKISIAVPDNLNFFRTRYELKD